MFSWFGGSRLGIESHKKALQYRFRFPAPFFQVLEPFRGAVWEPESPKKREKSGSEFGTEKTRKSRKKEAAWRKGEAAGEDLGGV